MPESHPDEVQRILNKVRHYNMEAEFDEGAGDGFTRLIISGPQLDLFTTKGTQWAPNVRIQGNAGPGKIAFMWSDANIAPAPKIETKPEGAIPDEQVLDMVPQSQVLTEQRLSEIMGIVSSGIESAYPGIYIDDKVYGKAKLDLVLQVMDRLYAISTRNLSRYMSICTLGLLKHLQGKNGTPEKLSLPESPVAIARR